MKIADLIRGLPVELYQNVGGEVTISGLCSHSKLVAPGDLFVAKKGTVDDGAKYIDEALLCGAKALLTDLPNPFLEDVVQLVTEDVRAVEGEFAARFYGNPSRELFTVGITGTNGKTTIAYLVKHFFDQRNLPCGMIGTIEYIVGKHHLDSDLTTPDVITNHRLLKEMLKQKSEAAVLEVSSIGLDQGRVDNIAFDVAIFSNLTAEHLDYHETMEAYREAKSQLFSSLEMGSLAVLNVDSPWFEEIKKSCPVHVLTYGIDNAADLQAHSIHLTPSETRFSVTYRDQTLEFSWNLIGRFNVYNALATMGAALCKGIPFETFPDLINTFKPARGRLEKVECQLPVYVDYAHSPDALEKALVALQEVKKGRLFTVFGCGGDRDRLKRPLMGEVAEKYSDFAFVTSDNPRTEDPFSICEEVVAGFSSSKYLIEVDRREAIGKAIEMASEDDIVLICGKGHETYQIFAHQTMPFDDRHVAQEIANRTLV